MIHGLSASYYLPVYFQVLGASATRAGIQCVYPHYIKRPKLNKIRILPFSLSSCVVSLAAGFIITATGQIRPLIWVSYVRSLLLRWLGHLLIDSIARYGARLWTDDNDGRELFVVRIVFMLH